MRRQRLRVGSFIKSLTLGVPGSPQTLLWVDWFHQKASNSKKSKVLAIHLLLPQNYVATFCRDRRLLGQRWTSSFQLSLAPLQLSPSCFSSRSSLSRRRSHSWSMTLKRPRATVTRARSSNLKRSSQVQQDRERHFGAPKIHSESTTSGESHPRVDLNCPKIVAIESAVSDQCTIKNSYVIYQTLLDIFPQAMPFI